MDTVLGIFLNFEDPDLNLSRILTEKESMAVTISQNRLLLNHLPGHFGFLNMWLAPEEVNEAVGILKISIGGEEVAVCNQARPCSFAFNNGVSFVALHIVLPSLNLLWTETVHFGKQLKEVFNSLAFLKPA